MHTAPCIFYAAISLQNACLRMRAVLINYFSIGDSKLNNHFCKSTKNAEAQTLQLGICLHLLTHSY